MEQRVKVHISEIKIGDVVQCPDGHARTVGRESITYDSFLGRRLWGDSYRLGYLPVTKIINA